MDKALGLKAGIDHRMEWWTDCILETRMKVAVPSRRKRIHGVVRFRQKREDRSAKKVANKSGYSTPPLLGDRAEHLRPGMSKSN
jgi:hypothetical protein